MTTLREIAELANVSTTTVSKVVNGDFSKVSPETRKKIEKLVVERHYYPNRIAKGLVEQKSRIIGLLLPSISNPFYAEMVQGIINLCESAGYSTMLFNTDEKPEREANYINALVSYRTDGVMLIGNERSVEKNLELLSRHGIPYVVVDSHTAKAEYSVTVNDYAGIYQMTTHLIRNGHSKIAFISGHGYVSNETNPRLEGYRKAMKDAGLPVNPQLVKMGAYEVQTGYEKSLELVYSDLPFTAIVCANDLIAIGACRAMRKCGLQVPHDVSITGYDNIFVSDILDPPLSTVKPPVYDMGVAAASMMLKRIRKQLDAPAAVTLEPTLMLRSSVGAPRERK